MRNRGGGRKQSTDWKAQTAATFEGEPCGYITRNGHGRLRYAPDRSRSIEATDFARHGKDALHAAKRAAVGRICDPSACKGGEIQVEDAAAA